MCVYALVRYQFVHHHDRELSATGQAVEAVLSENEDCANLTPEQLGELNRRSKLVLFHAVEGDGKVFYRSPDLDAFDVARELTKQPDFLKEREAFKTYQERGTDLRVYTRPYKSRVGRQGLIRVMESIGEVDAPLASLRIALFLLSPLAVLVSAVGGYWLAGRALKPVDDITRLAGEIGAGQLSRRLPEPPVRDELGRLAGTFNEMIARLEGSFHAMKRFTADAAHELRSPLANMQGTIEVTLSNPRDEAQYRAALASVADDVDRLRKIVEDLLILARADAGKLPFEREAVRLDILGKEVAESFQERAAASGVAIRSECSGPVIVVGDERWLRQLAFNLVDNAVKFTGSVRRSGREGEVAIRVGAENGHATLVVDDSGPGIPEADLERIFERFYRAESARGQGTKDGFGLGLSIAAWIVKSHAGTIRAERRTEGGARITVTIPASGTELR